MPDRHIVRFKVVKVESPVIRAGKLYTITYRRGETLRTTPSAKGDEGVVEFATMPEGAAVVHFRRGGARFAPKYISFRLEEYTPNRTRMPLGEVEVNCADVLGLHSDSGRGVRQVGFQINGLGAVISVAMLVYPDNGVPLSFDGLLPSPRSAVANAPADAKSGDVGAGTVRTLTRGEAMTLLISLETLLERKRANVGGAESGGATNPLLARIAELEEKRRTFASVDGLAADAVRQRTEGVVAAQYLALARKYRDNYTAEVAAYLREIAMTCGVGLGASMELLSLDSDTAREKHQRAGSRIEALQLELQKLARERTVLENAGNRHGVAEDVAANVQKMETVQAQIQLLEQNREAYDKVLRGDSTGAITILADEVQQMQKRIRDLVTQQESLQKEVDRMMEKAARNAVSWARSKNPPPADLHKEAKQDLNDLFSGVPATPEAAPARPLGPTERNAIVEALKKAQEEKAIQAARAAVDAVVGKDLAERRQLEQQEMGQLGLPSANDFHKEPPEEPPQTPPVEHKDPFMTGLGRDMFAPEGAGHGVSQAPAQLPSAIDFGQPRKTGAGLYEFGSGSYNFGGPASAVSVTGAPQASPYPMDSPTESGRGSGMATAPPTNDSFDFSPTTVVPDTRGAPAGSVMIEFTGGFEGFGKDTEPPHAKAGGTTSIAPASFGPPMFHFGPSEAEREPQTVGFTRPNFSFGSSDVTPETNTTSSVSHNYPQYNFGS